MIDRRDRDIARGRHPSGLGWRPDRRRFTQYMASVFAREGRPNSAVSAAVLSARGSTGETGAQFSARLGLAAELLGCLEQGGADVGAVPEAIADAAPWVDWPALRAADRRG